MTSIFDRPFKVGDTVRRTFSHTYNFPVGEVTAVEEVHWDGDIKVPDRPGFWMHTNFELVEDNS